jgi:hypothetical protein
MQTSRTRHHQSGRHPVLYLMYPLQSGIGSLNRDRLSPRMVFPLGGTLEAMYRLCHLNAPPDLRRNRPSAPLPFRIVSSGQAHGLPDA